MSGNSIFYSFPKQKRLQQEKFLEVGPGQYEPNVHKIKSQNPKWSFGTQKKNSFSKNSKTPAPNKYNISVQKNKKMGKFGSSKRQSRDSQNVPGPGNYQIPSIFEQNTKKNKGTSLYFKNKNQKQDETPGPNKYYCQDFVEQNKQKNKGQTIPKFKVQQEKTNKVGPGDYENAKIPFNKVKGGAMTKEIRQKDIKNNSPGPGTYEPPKIIGQEGVKSVFKQKYLNDPFEKEQKQKPGPGNYDGLHNNLKPKAPAFKFGTEQKNKLLNCKDNDKLGPCSYNIKDQKSKKGGFIGKDNINKRPQSSYVPGPGQYDTNKTTFQLDRNMGNFFQSKNFDQPNQSNKFNVGPGQYNPQMNIVKKRPQSCKFTTTQKHKGLKNDVPSPSKYNPKVDYSIKKNPAFKFGTEKKLQNKDKGQMPCPGTYDIKSDIVKKQKIFFAQKYKDIENMNVPSPGHYKPNIEYLSGKKNDKIGGKFTKDKKLSQTQKTNSPCPTKYQNISLKLGPGVKFGKDHKLRNLDKMQTPGPGHYEKKNLFEDNISKNKGVSMTFKKQLKSQFVVPGPGTYLLTENGKETLGSNCKNVNNVIFSKQKRFNGNNIQNIGPGSYETGTLAGSDKKNTKNTVFGKDNRFKENIKLGPGPGQYNQKSKFNEIPSYVRDQLPTKPQDYQFQQIKLYIYLIFQLALAFKQKFLLFFFKR